MNLTPQPSHDALERARQNITQRFKADPFLGYDKFEDAVADAKFTSQAEALARLFSGKNIFLSGPAGSGKTFVIERYLEWLDAEFEGRVNVAVTASTGIAAQILGGRTIHSWSGIGINTETFKQPVRGEWSKREDLETVDVLIIDEISMLPGYLFTRLDALLRYMRKSKAPFGGVQLIVMGDFMQLPPVGKSGDKTSDGEPLDNGFCIKTEAWKNAKFRALYLDKVHRAKDPQLKRVLASIAADKVDDRTRELVESRLGQPKDPSKKYMTLFTTNKNVDRYNDEKLGQNPNPETRLQVRYHGDSRHWETIKKSNGIAEYCRLKVGATVMLTANLPDTHANGSLGEVLSMDQDGCTVLFNDGIPEYIGYRDYSHVEKVLIRTDKRNGKDVEVFEEQVTSMVQAIPLKLGYAISVHKSQGQTFSAVEADLSFIFSAGLGYVALSRVGNLDDLVLVGNHIHPDTYRVDQQSLRYSKATKRAAAQRREEMLRNMAETARYFGESSEAMVPSEAPEISGDNPLEVAASQTADLRGAAEEEIAAEGKDSPLPAGFISYERLLTDPKTRAGIWETRVDDRRRRLERVARGARNF